MNINKTLWIPLALGVVLAGCQEKVEVTQNQEAIKEAQTMRGYFNKSGGDFNALSPSEQADAEKQIKGTANDVQKMFDWMKTSNKTAPASPGNMPPHR